MADKKLSVEIIAKDGASKVFAAVGSAATGMGKATEASAKTAAESIDQFDDANKDLGTSASKTFDKVGDSAEKMGRDVETSTVSATRSLKDFDEAGRTVGSGLAALGTAFTLYSRSVVENDQQIATLERTYGTASDSLQDFADQVQATTIYSNDAAVAAENVFGTLARNYGVSADEIQRLVGISTDLAATSGLGLADVAQRVASAIRGEAESAEALGLTMNQSAIDQGNLTLSMSNQEAAAFRLEALYGQVAFSTGAAADQANTTAGQFTQLGNQVQDAAQSFVRFTGPVGQAAAGISTFGLEAGIAAGGFIQVARGIKQASDAAGGARGALSVLTGFIGPGGLVAVGLGVTAIAAYKLYDAFNDDLPNAFDVAADGIDDVDIALKTLIATMDDVNLAIDLSEGQRQFNSLLDVLNEYNTAKATAEAPLDQVFTPVATDDPNAQAKIDAQNAALAESIALNQEVIDVFGSADAAATLYAQSQSALITVLENTAPGAQSAQQSIADLYATFDASDKGPEALRILLQGIIDTGNNLPAYTDAALAAQQANEGLAASFEDLATSLFSTNTILADLIRSGASGDIVSGFKDDILVMNSAISTMNQSLEGDALKQWQDDFLTLTTYVGPAAETVEQRLHDLNIQLMAGVLTPIQYADAVHSLGIELSALDDAAVIVGHTLDEMGNNLAEAFSKAQKPLREISELMPEIIGLGAGIKSIFEGIDGATTTRDQAEKWDWLATVNGHLAEQTVHLDKNVSALERRKDALSEAIATMEAFNAQFDAAAASVAGYSESLQSLQDMGFTGPELDLAVNLQISQSSLDNANRVIIGQTNAMAQQLDGVKSWADTLIGDPGVWSDMDKLLADGRIDADQYAAAQAAQVSISQDVTNAQEDLKAVQVSLAPVMADAVRQQAEYIDGLQDLGPEAQLAALGMMDQATSSKALGLAQLAASSTTEEMATQTAALIEQAAAADPALRAVLVSMGLINGETGEIDIDTSQATAAQDSMDKLVGVLGDLTTVLANIFGIDIDDTKVGPAQDKVDALIALLALLDAADANPDVDVDDSASQTIANIKALLDDLDGRNVTNTVTTNYVSTGSRDIGFVELATGGTFLPAYASGGTHSPYISNSGSGYALVGEYGPELAWLPSGTQITNAPATKSRMEAMGSGAGDVNFYGPVTLQPSNNDSYASIRAAALSRSRR